MSADPVADIYPLLPLQEGLLFHAQRDGGDDYVSQIAFTLDGSLDVQRFADAWRAVVARHEALRTAYTWEGVERPMAVVLRSAPPEIRVERSFGSEPDLHPAQQGVLAASERARPFDLCAPPLFRLLIVRTAESRSRVFWTAHHLSLDGWSIGLILRDVCEFYQAASTRPTRPPAPRFRDMVAWYAARDRAPSLEFWKSHLAGLRGPTALGLDPPGRSSWQTRSYTLSPEHTSRWIECARSHGVPLNTLTLGLWARALAALASAPEVTLGITLGGRPHELPEAAETVGHFVNTVPLRLSVELERGARSWLRYIQARLAEVEQHQWVPLTEVQAASDLPARAPLFESAYVFENYPLGRAATLPGLAIRDVRVDERTHYPLSLAVFPGERLTLKLIHDATRFSAARADATLERLLLLAEELSETKPRFSRAPLTPRENSGLQRLSQGAGRAPTEDVFTVLQRHADTQPTRIALECPRTGRTVDYRELSEFCARLAAQVRRIGVETEERVAIALPRGVDYWLAALSVLRAGATWIPLDPSYPSERLHNLIRSSQARRVIVADDARGRALCHARPASAFPGARARCAGTTRFSHA